MSAAQMMFGSFLQAQAPVRPVGRRHLAVLVSALAHAGLLVAAVALGVADRSPTPTPEPILLRLTPLRQPATAATVAPRAQPPIPERPAPVKRAPRPVPVVQPPAEIPPPPSVPLEQPEPPVEEAPAEDLEAESAEDAGAPETTAAAGPVAPALRTGGTSVGTGDAVLEVKDVARPPVVLHQVKPEYPREARWKRLEGTVIVRVVIGTDGRIQRALTRVMASVPELDALAVAAIEQWRFSPAIGFSGQPVRVAIEVPFRFTLR